MGGVSKIVTTAKGRDFDWPRKLLSLMPDKMAAQLRRKPFVPQPTLHPEDFRAVFRSIEELALYYPEEVDLTGMKFGRLRVVEFSHFLTYKDQHGTVHYDRWLVKCDCGPEKEVNGNHLRVGNTKSCGCARRTG